MRGRKRDREKCRDRNRKRKRPYDEQRIQLQQSVMKYMHVYFSNGIHHTVYAAECDNEILDRLLKAPWTICLAE